MYNTSETVKFRTVKENVVLPTPCTSARPTARSRRPTGPRMGQLFSQLRPEESSSGTILCSAKARKLAVSATRLWKNWRTRRFKLTKSGTIFWHGAPACGRQTSALLGLIGRRNTARR